MSKLLSKLILAFVATQWLVACTGTGDVVDESAGQEAVAGVRKSNMTKAELSEFQRALWTVKSGDTKKGEAAFEELSKKYPKLSEAHLNLGILRLKNKEFSGAVAALLEATKLNPNDAVAFNHLGVAYRYSGKFEKSKNAYLNALKLNNAYTLAHLNLGILYDIYFQDLAAALDQYQQYKKYSDREDPTVDKWIIDLERRVAKQQQAVKKG